MVFLLKMDKLELIIIDKHIQMRSFISFSVIPYVQCSYISTSIQYGDFKASKQHYCEKWK